MSAAEQKTLAARAALEFVRPGEVLGVGTGSTVDLFVDILGAECPDRVAAAVSSSEATTRRLRAHGIEVVGLGDIAELGVYVDGADEFEPGLALLKGGGAALTGEKIVASAAGQFVCIVDESKQVDTLGAFPLPIEVLPMAVGIVSRRLRALGGEPVRREGTTTDHGNVILDVHGLQIADPLATELELDAMPGVVTSGIFARHGADVVLMGTDAGLRRFDRPAG